MLCTRPIHFPVTIEQGVEQLASYDLYVSAEDRPPIQDTDRRELPWLKRISTSE